MKNFIYIILGILFSVSVTAKDLTGLKIYVNPGHGGYDGANDRNVVTVPFALNDTLGFWESSANLRKGLVLRDLLKAENATVIMSRTLNRDEDDRSLSEIDAEANANEVDAFLSIHSNASGMVNFTSNYPLMLYRGPDNQPEIPAALEMSKGAWARLIPNQLTIWSSYSATNPNLRGDLSFYPIAQNGLGVLRTLTVPGFLSEGSFHDYLPEAHRLLNPDYCRLEAVNFFRFYCDYFQADIPAKGIIAGWVKGQDERISEPLFVYRTNTTDQWKPLNEAEVKLKNAAGDLLSTYKVDKFYNGIFVFYDLEPGTYTLEYSAPDHTSTTASVVVKAKETVYANQLLVNPNLEIPKETPPDYPNPEQEAGVLPLNQYTFGAGAVQTPEWLNTAQIRKVLYRNDKYYVLTEEPKILIVKAADYTLVREMDLTGISGGIKTISDINFTSDGYLLACNKDNILLTAPTTYFKVYTWDNDDAVPSELFKAQYQGNWNEGTVGETFAVSGPRWKCYLYVPAVTTGSAKQIRIMGFIREEGQNLGYKYMMDATNYTEALWGAQYKFTISPSGSDRIIVDSDKLLPTEYKFNWLAPDRDPLQEKQVFAEQSAYAMNLIPTGNYYFRHAQHVFMAAPVCKSDSTEVGVALFDITSGLNQAKKVSEKLPEAGLGTQKATYMMAAAKVRGYDLDLMILAKNQGVAKYSTVAAAVTPNIYASELKISSATKTEAGFSFTINADASSVSIIVHDETGDIKTIDAGALTKGQHTIPVDITDLPKGTYSWSVNAVAGAVDRPVKVTDNANVLMQFYSPRGVAVDNDFDSPFFGRVYASETTGGAVTNRTTQKGIYILNAALEDITNQGASSYGGNVTWGAASSPMRLCVAPDGKIYLTDWSDTHSGVWIMDPANPTQTFTEVFAGLTRNDKGLASKDGVSVHGSIPHCWVTGKGEDTKLFTFDEDYVNAVATNTGNLLQYNIGNLTSPWQQAPSAIIYNDGLNGNLQQNMNSCIAPDGRDGWWISQYRATDAANIPSLIHVSATGSADFNSGITPTLIENSNTGGMAVSYDGSRLAMGCNNEIKVFDVIFSEAGIPSLTRIHSIKPGLGANSCGLAFDRAGNVYLISNSNERLGVWALPKPDNSFTTPAPESQKLIVGLTDLDQLKNPENDITVYPNPVTDRLTIESKDATIEMYSLYNMNGQLIQSEDLKNRAGTQYEIYFNQLPAGVYILKIKTNEGLVSKRVIRK